jgi:hypothetical protein
VIGPKLTDEQLAEVHRDFTGDCTPVRFLYEGRALRIESGDLSPKGINVIHQPVYWWFSKETSSKIAEWLGVKAVFSE